MLDASHPAAGAAFQTSSTASWWRDRGGQTVDALVGRGALEANQLERHSLPVLDRQALLVTDANAACRAFSRQHGIAHQYVTLRAAERLSG